MACSAGSASFIPEHCRPQAIDGDILDYVPVQKKNEVLEAHAAWVKACDGDVRGHIGKLMDILSSVEFEADTPDTDNKLLAVDIAGMDCSDFSPRGNRGGVAGKSFRVMIVYLMRVKKSRPHVVILEEASYVLSAGLQIVELVLGEEYMIEPMRICLSEFGWPITRKRSWMLLRLKRACHILTEFNDCMIDCFRRSTELVGNDMYVMQPGDSSSSLGSSSSHEEASAVQGFRLGRLQSQVAQVADLPSGHDKNICNVMHNYTNGHVTRMLPSWTRSSTKLISFQKRRHLRPEQHLVAMGIPALTCIKAPYPLLFDMEVFKCGDTMEQIAGGPCTWRSCFWS